MNHAPPDSTPKTVQQELAELEAKREAIALRREAFANAEAEADKLAAAQRGLADDEKIEALELEHGTRKIAVLRTELGAVVVKRPHLNTFRKFQDHGATDSEALGKLVRPCLVHPDVANFEKICAERPATLMQVANACIRLAGVRSEDLAGKS